ncbi:MAG: hypothetical protein K9K65_15820 [Desulfarculaceae bacterium]|nr:hypothetical protein [Desulfarculaceae bacterium]MCF8046742.1 hypothetical protein [Desulfarculaceae bacterium]MCF8099306.1 hypothetical protein [Desulfarculaceae bacterium]MCF8124520.1 hypothetical protein [Desulfarculaceae bacterium]
MAAKIASQRPAMMIRSFLRDAGGEASVGELYEHLIDGAGHTLRQVNRALDYLGKRGEIILLPDCRCRLVEEAYKGNESAPALLWRAAYQLSLRGAFSSKDLMQVSGIIRWKTYEWLHQMRKRGLIIEIGKSHYRVVKGAPHRDDPPTFGWARRGKARA